MMFTRRCAKCLLPESYPDVGLDENRVCRYCLGTRHFGVEADPAIRAMIARKEELKADFERTVEASRGQGPYDCLVPLSGGKDSSYLAYILKHQCRLRILTLTVDTGLLSPLARPNVARVTSKLNVDHMFCTPKPEFFRKLYRYLLMHPSFEKKGFEETGYLSTVCRVCCRVIHSIALQVAAQRGIPFVALAYSPDQIEYHFYEVPREEICERNWIPELLHDPPFEQEDRRYFWDPQEYCDRPCLPRLLLPWHVLDYPGADQTTRKVVELGLLGKRKASMFVTNCRMNWLMLYLDARRLGYNSYVASLSHQVRHKHISRTKWVWLLELERMAVKCGLYGRLWKARELRDVLQHLNLRLSDFPQSGRD